MLKFDLMPEGQIWKKRFIDEKKFSDYIPITQFVTPQIFKTIDNVYGFVVELVGIPFHLTDNDSLNADQSMLNRLLIDSIPKFSYQVIMHRHKFSTYPHGEITNEFAREFEDEYKQRFNTDRLFKNSLFLVVTTRQLLGKTPMKMNVLENVAKIFSANKKGANKDIFGIHQRNITMIKRRMKDISAMLKDFTPRILGEKEIKGVKTLEVLGLYGRIANAGTINNYRYPYGNCAGYVPKNRLWLGSNTLEFVDQLGNRRFAALISIKHYAPHSASITFDRLLSVNFEYIRSDWFLPDSPDEARKFIKSKQGRLISSGEASQKHLEEGDEALEVLATREAIMGYHTMTLMVFADDREQLDDNIAEVKKIFAEVHIESIREDINLEAAYWSMFPGNAKYLQRKPKISSNNFADFCSMHNFSTGFIDENYLGSALAMLETGRGTHYYYNFHIRGSKTELSAGHTCVTGETGSGKTTFILFTIMNLCRYNCTTFFFDYRGAIEPFVHAMKGIYIHFKEGIPTGFAPFQMKDTKANRSFLSEHLMPALLKREEGDELNADEMKEVRKIVSSVFNTFPDPRDRTLTNVNSFIPHQFGRKTIFEQWLNQPGTDNLGYLFDNAEDKIEMGAQGQIIGFDMTAILEQSITIRTPVMIYMLHRIYMQLDGQLCAIMMDEAWCYLEDPFWKKRINEILAAFRKENAFFTLITQNPATILDSPCSASVLKNTVTSVFFPGKGMDYKDYAKFGVSEREFTVLKGLHKASREMLIKQENESTIARLDLSTMKKFLAVVNGSPIARSTFDECHKQYGENWLPHYLKRMGVEEESEDAA